MKLIWLTDLHLTCHGKKLYGHDTESRLRHAVRYIEEFHSDADYCVLTGDLVDCGDAESYALLHAIMATLGVPYLALPGNHDVRDAMRENLTLPERTDSAFIQFSVFKDGYRLIGLDTLYPEHSQGILCDSRLSWLDRELEQDTDTPTLVFCHHHPAVLSLPMQDGEMLLNGEALLDKLCAKRNVKHLFFGHVHRPVSGSFRNLGFSALQSAALQAPLPYPAWDWGTFDPAVESPALGIIHATPDSVVTHFHPFCRPETHRDRSDA